MVARAFSFKGKTFLIQYVTVAKGTSVHQSRQLKSSGSEAGGINHGRQTKDYNNSNARSDEQTVPS